MQHRDVTVLMIWNGSGNNSKWQVGDVLKHLLNKKRVAAAAEEAADEEDEDDEEGGENSVNASKRRRSIK